MFFCVSKTLEQMKDTMNLNRALDTQKNIQV
jgi:hypothetical protein